MSTRIGAEISRSDLLGTLSLASDLGVGLAPQHGLRACYIALRIAEQMGLDTHQQRDVVYVALLKDAGCTSWTTQIAAMIRGDEIAARREILFVREFGDIRDVMGWAAKFVGAGSPLPARAGRLADFMVSGRDFMREGFQSSGEVACRIAERLGASTNARLGLASLFEQWNGKGMPRGLKGEAIPLISRIVFATSYLEVAHSAGGKEAALEVARERAGSAFDPAVVDAFANLAESDGFWEPLADNSVLARIEEHLADAAADALEEFASCCADFVDMKAYWLAGHSRRVADLAERLARRMRLADEQVRELRLAGLVHDLGLVAVPSFVLNKPPDERTASEREAIEAHGDVLRTLFERTPSLARIGEIAWLHHGRGIPDGTANPGDAAAAAGILAVANEFDELTHDSPGTLALDPNDALQAVTAAFAEGAFAPAAAALAAEVRGPTSPPQGREQWPAGLTGREVEVLRLLAAGLNRKKIAGQLVVSESTVRSHLEHIYSKLDVSTRVGAVLFALEHGLVL